MKINLLSILLFFSICLSAQPLVLTQAAHEPAVGDVDSYYYLDTALFTTGLHVSMTGSNTLWNFTNLRAMNPVVFTAYTDPATDTNAAHFTGCNIVQDDGFVQTFLKSTTTPTTQTEVLGIISNTMAVTFTNSAIAAKYPVSFGTNSSDNIGGTFSAFSFTGTCSGNITTTADGTGTLMLPNGVTLTNVLRVKSVQTVNFNQGFIPLATIKQTLYNYYHASKKFAVLGISYQSISLITSSTPTVGTAVTGSSDLFIPVGIKENNLDAATLSIYPNPVAALLHLDLDIKLEPKTIAIYTQLGQVICRKPYNNTLNVETLTPGIYFIELSTDAGTIRKKLIKE